MDKIRVTVTTGLTLNDLEVLSLLNAIWQPMEVGIGDTKLKINHALNPLFYVGYSIQQKTRIPKAGGVIDINRGERGWIIKPGQVFNFLSSVFFKLLLY